MPNTRVKVVSKKMQELAKKRRKNRASTATLIKREEAKLLRLKQKKKLEDLRNEVKEMRENI